jgi:hypothetical protein
MTRLLLMVWLLVGLSPLALAQSGTARRADAWGIIAVETETGEAVTVRLAGIEWPRPGAPGHGVAMRALDAILDEAGPVSIAQASTQTDRYGHLIADLDLNGASLTETLVRRGYALAYSWPETRASAPRLLLAEAEAREQEYGLWGAGVFQVRSPDPNILALYLETVQIVEGRVISVGETRERTYLNFGFEYRTDFTVSVAQEDVAAFAEANLDLAALEGHVVRVRGWVQAINGPSISVDHPERIEVITPRVAAD